MPNNVDAIRRAVILEYLERVKSCISNYYNDAKTLLSSTTCYRLIRTSLMYDQVEIATLILSNVSSNENQDYKRDELLIYTILQIAVAKGYETIVETIIDRGYNIDKVHFDDPLLHIATRMGQDKMVDLLLRKMADPNVRNNAGTTALHIAVRSDELTNDITRRINRTKIYDLLRKYRAMENVVDENGQTPLHLAASNLNDTTYATRLLINPYIWKNATDKKRRTPLWIAAISGNILIVEWLLHRGADINIMPEIGEYPSVEAREIFARTSDYRHLVDVLTRHIVKMRAACMHVDPTNLGTFYGCEKHDFDMCDDFAESCKREIEVMKTINVMGELSMYDFIRRSPNKMATYSCYEDIPYGSVKYVEQFPIYGNLYLHKFLQSEIRRCTLNSNIVNFNNITGNALPDYLVVEIFYYLSNEDLENLTKAGTPKYQKTIVTNKFRRIMRDFIGDSLQDDNSDKARKLESWCKKSQNDLDEDI